MIYTNNADPIVDKIYKSMDKFVSQKQTRRYEETQLEYIRPLVDVYYAEYIIQETPILNKVIRVLSQDVILNNYTLDMPKILETSAGNNEDLDTFNTFWNDSNKFQLYLASVEFFSYGYGACEIRYNEYGVPVKIEQIPAKSIRIRIREFGGQRYCYVEQQINGDIKLLRISHSDKSRGTDYTYLDENGIDDESSGWCIWIGGGTLNSWYSTPYWRSAKTSILTTMHIDKLNYKKISSGNIPSGLLILSGSRRKQLKNEPSLEEQIHDQMFEAGNGTAMIFLDGITPDSKIDSNYIKLEDENYEYMSELKKECISIILEVYGVPKIRLMIDDITESMNSNKSDTLYEIYNKSIESEQFIFKEVINNFNHDELGIQYDCVMDTPEFNDKTNVKITSVVSLFEEGLLTLGQAVEYLSRLLPDVNFDMIMDSDEQKLSRYYKGSLLGSTDAMTPTQLDDFDVTQQLMSVLEEATGNGLFQ